MENSEQHIKEAFEACAKVRKGKAELYGHSWRLANYYTLVNIIYYKAKAAIEKPWDYNTRKEALIATYNYAIFAKLQYDEGACELHELAEDKEAVTKAVERIEMWLERFLIEKNREYSHTWEHCDFDYLHELIFVKIARIHSLRAFDLEDEDNLEPEHAMRDAFSDIAGYAILCLARLAIEAEKQKQNKQVETTDTKVS